MDQRDFPQFYRKYVQRIYKFLYYRLGGNTSLAQDLTQDVFLKAFQAFDRYDEKISESSWVYTIARNHLINHLAKTKPQVDLEEIENTNWDHDDWATRAEIRYDEKRLLEAISQLPKQDAMLVRRKYLEGWSYEDIAEMEGRSSGALRVQAHRVLKQLRIALKQP
jgi:RNA polymerase sigma-70 factor (ECF subfamily)